MRDAIETLPVYRTSYDTNACDTGVVHLGFGAFHRAHQAQYFDDYMQASGDLRWGITAVNLRAAEASRFAELTPDGYLLKSIDPDGTVALREIRSHIGFVDWTVDATAAEALLARDSVHMVTITVTESGYYTDPAGDLDIDHPVISEERAGKPGTSVYAYLRSALRLRMSECGAPLTICCCDNIRRNGKMLQRNLNSYLLAMGDVTLAGWIDDKVTFPCSMVDRITPRAPAGLASELAKVAGALPVQPVMAEAFAQWVLEDNFAGPKPDLAQAGVTLTDDVDPFEETKIRVLNGGHTGLVYLAALQGLETFDAAMRDLDLLEHFWAYEQTEVLAALTLDLPFSKADYLASIADRFCNPAIADTIARISADGMAKFPIFIRPTLEGCLAQGIMPVRGIKSIASWHCFAQHVAAGRIPFEYVEPAWDQLSAMLGTDAFVMSDRLWGDLPVTYPAFADALRAAIKEMELTWPV